MKTNNVYITGDMHGSFDTISEYLLTLKKNDWLIIAGDFGIPWTPIKNLGYEHELEALQLLSNKINACFIDGNHENFDLLKTFPIEETSIGKVRNVNGVYQLLRGEIYQINNQTIFTFGGARSIDKAYRTPYVSWWPDEECNYQEIENAITNLEKVNWTVDYVITHTAPIAFSGMHQDIIKNKGECNTQAFLSSISSKINYKKWYFGHFHDDINSEKLKARLLFEKIVKLGE